MSRPLMVSSALHVELLSWIINNHIYPTTLIVCAPKDGFISALIEDANRGTREEHNDRGGRVDGNGPQVQQAQLRTVAPVSLLEYAPLYQVAITKHIRVVFIPTVSHLRAHFSVFSQSGSAIAPPPTLGDASIAQGRAKNRPALFVYGFLELHRDTSEWSAQGISNTAAALVETACHSGLQPIIVEPKKLGDDSNDLSYMLDELIPVLDGSTRRAAGESEGGGWIGRTTSIRRVLSRWFLFQERVWDIIILPESKDNKQ